MIKRMNTSFTVALSVCALLMLPATSTSLLAAQDQVPQLQKRIAELQARVEYLEGLLKKCKATEQSVSVNTYGWQNKKNWRTLKVGMDKKKVKQILGEPIKVIKGIKTLWYYPNFYDGYVSFDESGKLAGWNEP